MFSFIFQRIITSKIMHFNQLLLLPWQRQLFVLCLAILRSNEEYHLLHSTTCFGANFRQLRYKFLSNCYETITYTSITFTVFITNNNPLLLVYILIIVLTPIITHLLILLCNTYDILNIIKIVFSIVK